MAIGLAPSKCLLFNKDLQQVCWSVEEVDNESEFHVCSLCQKFIEADETSNKIEQLDDDVDKAKDDIEDAKRDIDKALGREDGW